VAELQPTHAPVVVLQIGCRAVHDEVPVHAGWQA
jgi:hypothetical protein